jgi:hypothetical protein
MEDDLIDSRNIDAVTKRSDSTPSLAPKHDPRRHNSNIFQVRIKIESIITGVCQTSQPGARILERAVI